MTVHPIAFSSKTRFFKITIRSFIFAILCFFSIKTQAQRTQLLETVLISGEPIAPNPQDSSGELLLGTGLCGGYRYLGPERGSTPTAPDPELYFPKRNPNYPSQGVTELADAINAFMDGIKNAPTSTPRADATLRSNFDLTNFLDLPGLGSRGDFILTPGCETYRMKDNGCWFPAATKDPVVLSGSFAARYRGFINIPKNWVNQSIHFGFYTDDAVGMAIYSKNPITLAIQPQVVISRAPVLGALTYRVTNTVRFLKPGLYPIEITYANYINAAVLEMAVLFDATFLDIDEFAGFGTKPLGTLGFLLDYTQPAQFFQTTSGSMAYPPDIHKCQQCPRNYANIPNQPAGICDSGMFCNEAAVCAPCEGDQFCGTSCVKCSAPKPFCVKNPKTGSDFRCVECKGDADCSNGNKCIQNQCINPCNCCSGQFCVETDSNKKGVLQCSDCRDDHDCDGGVCDLLNGRCTKSLPSCNTDERCGKNCVSCKEVTKNDPDGVRPYCLNGEVCVSCKHDSDCAIGTFCRSGDCLPCTDDKHCGPNCTTCGIGYVIAADGTITRKPPTETPFCYSKDGRSDTAVCVRCLKNKDCGEGGICDVTTKKCNQTCTLPCPANQVCQGTKCVDCFTSSQCPCGICQDGSCQPKCESSSDCLGTQCCNPSNQMCQPGRCKAGLEPKGGALCCEMNGVGAAQEDHKDEDCSHSLAIVLCLVFSLSFVVAVMIHRKMGIKHST